MVTSELVEYVSNTTRITKVDADIIVRTVIKGIKKGLLKDGIVKLLGLGSLVVSKRKSYECVSGLTKELVSIPERNFLRFNISRKFRLKLNE